MEAKKKSKGKVGEKELAQRKLQADKLSRAHQMMLEDGCPPELLRFEDPTKPKPQAAKKKSDAGVTLAPPLAVQKAIAADLAEDESPIDSAGYQRNGKLVEHDDLAIVAKAVAISTQATALKEGIMATTQSATKSKATPAAVKANPKALAKGKGATKSAAPKKAKGGNRKPRYDFEAAAAAAKTGKVPPKPALTHKSYAKHADAIEKLAKAGDLAGLKKYEPTFAAWLKDQCSFRTPLAHYRANCMTALSK